MGSSKLLLLLKFMCSMTSTATPVKCLGVKYIKEAWSFILHTPFAYSCLKQLYIGNEENNSILLALYGHINP